MNNILDSVITIMHIILAICITLIIVGGIAIIFDSFIKEESKFKKIIIYNIYRLIIITGIATIAFVSIPLIAAIILVSIPIIIYFIISIMGSLGGIGGGGGSVQPPKTKTIYDKHGNVKGYIDE